MKRKQNFSTELQPPARRSRFGPPSAVPQPPPKKPTRFAAGSRLGSAGSSGGGEVGGGGGEVDPLDAFMQDLQQKEAKSRVAKLNKQLANKDKPEGEGPKGKKKSRIRRLNERLEGEDTQASFLEKVESGKVFVVKKGEGDDDSLENVQKLMVQHEKHMKMSQDSARKPIQYDKYGNIITPDKDRMIGDLPPVDHEKTYYRGFKKNFYNEHPQVAALNPLEMTKLRASMDIRVTGTSIAKPVCSFAHFQFDDKLMDALRRQKFEKPTPIQCQAIPCLLQGRDVIGIAQTGSGKTAAFLWPGIIHVLDQDRPEEKEGPIGVFCAPTRELAEQTYQEAVRYAKRPYGLKIIPLTGGMMMYEQRRDLEKGCDIVVCTPGRIIDLVKKKWATLYWCTYLVFDECDRMFSMGFETQVRSIFGQCRPNRQVLMFSATMPKKLEVLCREQMRDPIRITIGRIGSAAKTVDQIVDVLNNDHGKWVWLKSHIQDFIRAGAILIFCCNKMSVEKLSKELMGINVRNVIVHGDKTQVERQQVIKEFRGGQVKVLVATDVASRGLDIRGLETVINYDAPRNMDIYTHRIGRTGRAGRKGTAYTLINKKNENDRKLAPALAKQLQVMKMLVPQALSQMGEAKTSAGSFVRSGPRHLSGARKADAKASFHKGGFNSKNKKAAKKSFMSAFTSSGNL